MIRRHVPRLLRSGEFEAVLLGLDLAIPPLALLALAHASVLAFAWVYGLACAHWQPFSIASSSAIWLAASVVLAWSRFGRALVPANALLAIPAYVLWKIPVYVGFARRRESEWIRTARVAPRREP